MPDDDAQPGELPDGLYGLVLPALAAADCFCEPGDPTCEDWRDGGRPGRLDKMARAVCLALVTAKALRAPPPPEPDGEPLPEGIFARVELPGRREHTGWVTRETGFGGAEVAVVRDWDGNMLAEVVPGPGCQLVHLPTPLKRPDPLERRALPAAVGGWGDPDPYAGDEF